MAINKQVQVQNISYDKSYYLKFIKYSDSVNIIMGSLIR